MRIVIDLSWIQEQLSDPIAFRILVISACSLAYIFCAGMAWPLAKRFCGCQECTQDTGNLCPIPILIAALWPIALAGILAWHAGTLVIGIPAKLGSRITESKKTIDAKPPKYKTDGDG